MSISAYRVTSQRVSQLAATIQRALRSVGSGWVEGEVQKLRRASSGHVYFSLADADATIECCVWRSAAARIREWPREGALVQAHFAKADFYARSGRISLHVDHLRLTGEGELLARKQAVLDRLTADGLVARARRPLPAFPRRVGVIAARDSDAKVDVVKALRERWPSVQIVYRASLVEGVHAVDSVIEALGQLQDVDGVDVIVLARGGGAVRDLVAFDDERLCRAVFACAAPVVTSIGHTAQRPNCDHVSAAYADVPARAAELVVPSAAELSAELDRLQVRLGRVRVDLDALEKDVISACTRARRRGGDYERAFTRLREQADAAFARGLRERARELALAAAALGDGVRRRQRAARDSLEHLTELARAKDFRRSGWILAGDASGRPVRSAVALRPGAELHLHFHDGAASAAVTHVHQQEGDADG